MKDDREIVQIYSVPVVGGEIQQVTALSHSVQAQFNVSPDGRRIALIADNSIWTTDVHSGRSVRLIPRSEDGDSPLVTVVWDNAGRTLVYNRYVDSGNGRHLQIFKLQVN